MRNRWFVSLFVALVLGICLTTVASPLVQATPSKQGAGKPQCVVHEVHLHGNQPATIKCARWSSTGVTPYTVEESCPYQWYILKISSTTQGDWCFEGVGYIPLGSSSSGNIYNVYHVDSDAFQGNGGGWLMYYNPPFTAGTGIKFGFASVASYNNPPFAGQQKVTQVCSGGTPYC